MKRAFVSYSALILWCCAWVVFWWNSLGVYLRDRDWRRPSFRHSTCSPKAHASIERPEDSSGQRSLLEWCTVNFIFKHYDPSVNGVCVCVCVCHLQVLPPLRDVRNRPEVGDALRNKLVRLMTHVDTDLKDAAADFLFVLCKENGQTWTCRPDLFITLFNPRKANVTAAEVIADVLRISVFKLLEQI